MIAGDGILSHAGTYDKANVEQCFPRVVCNVEADAVQIYPDRRCHCFDLVFGHIREFSIVN